MDSSGLPLGQYIPTGSFIHQLDVRARIFLFSFPVFALILSPSLLGICLGLGIVLLGIVLSRVPIGLAARSLLPAFPLIFILAALQLLFWKNPSSDVLFQAGGIQIYWNGILSGIKLCVRFTALILILNLASFCISSSMLIDGLESLLKPLARLKLPVQDIILTIEVTLNFLPFLARSMENIAKAQAARGADWDLQKVGILRRVRQIVPLIVPLFLLSLRRAERLALAMDARGFHSKGEHTSLNELFFGWRDSIAVLFAVLVSIIIIIV
jgi:energy-coupling factor transport system permease protein